MKNIFLSLLVLLLLSGCGENKTQNVITERTNPTFTILPYAVALDSEEISQIPKEFAQKNYKINPAHLEGVKRVLAANEMAIPQGLQKAGASDIKAYIKSQGNKGGISLFAQQTAYKILYTTYNSDITTLLADAQNRQIDAKDAEKALLALELLTTYQNPNADLLLALGEDLKQHGHTETAKQLLQSNIKATERTIERYSTKDRYKARVPAIQNALKSIKAL
jgi:hypothetical protein